jgi:cytochrome P450
LSFKCFSINISKNVLFFQLKSIISERESQKGPKKIDFLQLLIDAKTKQMDNKDIDEDIKLEVQMISESMKKRGFQLEEIDILATSLLFILAGNETTSSTLGYLFHELALNTDCQQKLYEEIKSFGDRIDYDTISQMPYLESCVSETLRMYPPIVLNQRIATEDYELGIDSTFSMIEFSFELYLIFKNRRHWTSNSQRNGYSNSCLCDSP